MGKAPRIYTKTGDKGMTGLVGGNRVSKGDPRLETYGTVDELNSILGVARATLRRNVGHPFIESLLEETQNTLFNLGSRLACDDEKTAAMLPDIRDKDIQRLEQAIDKMTDELPELRQFILPGGTEEAAALHWARTVCRRAERELVRFSSQNSVDDIHVRYLNRLSDLLFVAARYANHQRGEAEVTWKKTE